MSWTTVFEDDLNGSFGTPIVNSTPEIGTGWNDASSSFQHAGGTTVAKTSNNGTWHFFEPSDTIAADQSIEITRVDRFGAPGIGVRNAAGPDGYFFINRGDPFHDNVLYRMDDGSGTLIDSSSGSYGSAEVSLRLEIIGADISGYVSSVLVVEATDSAYPSGKPALWGSATGTNLFYGPATIQEWSGDEYPFWSVETTLSKQQVGMIGLPGLLLLRSVQPLSTNPPTELKSSVRIGFCETARDRIKVPSISYTPIPQQPVERP